MQGGPAFGKAGPWRPIVRIINLTAHLRHSPMPNRLFAEIAETKLFNGVSLDALERLLEWCEVIELPAGHVLLEPGQDNEHLYVLLQGQLEIHLSKLDELLKKKK